MFKNLRIIILFGCLISVLFSFYTINKFDKNYLSFEKKFDHYLIKGDIAHYFEQAKSYNKSLKEKKFFTNYEYAQSYLHPKIISAIYYITNTEIEISNRINSNFYLIFKNIKFIFFFIQTIVYYFSILFLSKCLINKIHPKILLILVIFLSLEPTLVQWNSTFFTESIFLSMLIISIGLLIKINNSIFKNLLI